MFLENCPHCGNPAEMFFKIPIYGAGGCEIKCNMCGARVNDFNFSEHHVDDETHALSTPVTIAAIAGCIERAVEKWNRRVENG